MTFERIGRHLVFALSACLLFVPAALAQTDVERKTVAITYPLDETVTVKFRGTTVLPRLKGEAKVRRAGRRGTRVEFNVEDLPRASELGGIYTTYILWAISPDGRVDNLGEIKRSGSTFVDSKLDVTTPLQTFAMVLTAEPHFLMKVPSRMVVMENLPPQRANGSQVETVDVRYIGNSSDYFRTARVPELADREYRQIPVSILGARQAVNLAKYAGASQEAAQELQSAEELLQEAEKTWRLQQPISEVDVLARKATSAGARAEELAVERRAARTRREEIRRRDEAVRTAEQSADAAERELAQVRAALDKEQRAREQAERDLGVANDQLREKRVENAQLRDENQLLRSEGDSAKVKLARMEGEKQAETARVEADRRAAEKRAACRRPQWPRTPPLRDHRGRQQRARCRRRRGPRRGGDRGGRGVDRGERGGRGGDPRCRVGRRRTGHRSLIHGLTTTTDETVHGVAADHHRKEPPPWRSSTPTSCSTRSRR